MYIWILGPPNIWETASARTLKFKKKPLDMVKFPYNKNNITVYSHTKSKRKENDISPAYKMSYEHSSNGDNIKHLSPIIISLLRTKAAIKNI